MNKISKKAYKKCEIEIIDGDKYFWINRRLQKLGNFNHVECLY